jgi:hypothetical protein
MLAPTKVAETILAAANIVKELMTGGDSPPRDELSY